MPDLDSFDLDAAFERLERDIASVSSSRGAGLAVATARRRRRTTISAAAALIVLTIVGVAIGHGFAGRNDSIRPSQQPLPPPTSLSAASLSTATAGWVDDWARPTVTQSRALIGFTCMSLSGDPSVSPPLRATRSGSVEYGGGTSAFVEVDALEFAADRIGAASSAAAAGAASCDPTVTSTRSYADGSQVTHYQIPSTNGSGEIQVWIARFGNRLGVEIVGGAADPPSPDVVGRVDDLVVGALQVDSSLTASPVGPNAYSYPYDFGPVSKTAFHTAIGAWPNGWQQSGTKLTSDPLPCAGDWTIGSTVDTGSGLGANGWQEFHSFENPAHARSAVQALVGNLRACAASPPDITTVAGTGSVPITVTVAVGSGSDARVTWIVQYGATAGYLTIPAGTSPPEKVSQAVGDDLSKVLETAVGHAAANN